MREPPAGNLDYIIKKEVLTQEDLAGIFCAYYAGTGTKCELLNELASSYMTIYLRPHQRFTYDKGAKMEVRQGMGRTYIHIVWKYPGGFDPIAAKKALNETFPQQA